MRYLLPLVLIFCFASCLKIEVCRVCVTTTITTASDSLPGFPSVHTKAYEVCQEGGGYDAEGAITRDTITQGGIIYITTSSTECSN